MMRDWKSRRAAILLIVLPGIVFLIFACQSFTKKLDYEYCPITKGEPAQFWTKYNLPKVEGAILCADYSLPDGKHSISFIHYHESDKNPNDFSKLYSDEFQKNGWKIEDYKSQQYSIQMYAAKDGDKFFMEFIDCYAGQTNYAIALA